MVAGTSMFRATPSAHTLAVSVAPMPNAKVFKALWLVVCEDPFATACKTGYNLHSCAEPPVQFDRALRQSRRVACLRCRCGGDCAKAPCVRPTDRRGVTWNQDN